MLRGRSQVVKLPIFERYLKMNEITLVSHKSLHQQKDICSSNNKIENKTCCQRFVVTTICRKFEDNFVYQLGWEYKLATVKRFGSWRFERSPFVGTNLKLITSVIPSLFASHYNERKYRSITFEWKRNRTKENYTNWTGLKPRKKGKVN